MSEGDPCEMVNAWELDGQGIPQLVMCGRPGEPRNLAAAGTSVIMCDVCWDKLPERRKE